MGGRARTCLVKMANNSQISTMARTRIAKSGYQAAKLKIFKINSPRPTKAKTRQFPSNGNKSVIAKVPLTPKTSDLETEKANESSKTSKRPDEFIFPLSPTASIPKPNKVENQKPKHRVKKQLHQQTRSKEEQRRINAKVLLIVQKTQESIQALRNGIQLSVDNKRQFSSGSGKRPAHKTIAVEVSITNPDGIRKSQFTVEQSGSKEEEKIGMQPKRVTGKPVLVLL